MVIAMNYIGMKVIHKSRFGTGIKPIICFTTIILLGVFPFDAGIIRPIHKTVLKKMGLPPLFLIPFPNNVLGRHKKNLRGFLKKALLRYAHQNNQAEMVLRDTYDEKAVAARTNEPETGFTFRQG